jgi:xylulokinase
MNAALGLDVGTTSLKAVTIGEDGSVLNVVQREYPFLTPRPGWSEQDPSLWWKATQAVLDAIDAPITGIGLSGQMHGLVALDAQDRPVRPAILWNDQRTAAEAEELEGLVPDLMAETGNRSMTGFTAPKLMWLRRHEPDLYERIAHVMLPKDYVRLRLCGQGTYATDVTDAAGTSWFDVGARRWSEPVTEALELDSGWLPPALESADVSGHTDNGAPVAAGAGDQAAGAVGVGALPGGPASIVLGTSGVVLSPADRYTDPDGSLQLSCHALPDGWFSMGVMLSAAGSLQWLSSVTGTPPATLVHEAASAPAGCDGLMFLPYLSGERAPRYEPAARGAFIGLSVSHGRSALARAVLEGVAFALASIARLGPPAAYARVSGGGARSDLWLRILASALGLPLERVAVEEGAAFGAALLGGVAGGMWPSVQDAVATCVRVSGEIAPEPEWAETYAAARERFESLWEVALR